MILSIQYSLGEASENKTANQGKIFSVTLPSGRMTFPVGGQWKWSDSCHSKRNPCYSGKIDTSGSAYLFAAPTPGADSKTGVKELCSGIHELTSKYAQSAPEEARPRPFQIRKTANGLPYCTWAQGNTFNYFWKVGDSLVSIAFSPLKSASPSFLKQVETLVQGVRIHEK